jgi:uncharacterized membrane protein
MKTIDLTNMFPLFDDSDFVRFMAHNRSSIVQLLWLIIFIVDSLPIIALDPSPYKYSISQQILLKSFLVFVFLYWNYFRNLFTFIYPMERNETRFVSSSSK